MVKKAVVSFLAVVSILFVLTTFTGCLPLFGEQWVTEQATTLQIQWFENNASVGPWFFWQEIDGFAGDPVVANGTIIATRTNVSAAPYQAQLLRFLEKDKSKYRITLKLRASTNVTINYFFGREPYVWEQDQNNEYIRGTIAVTTTEQETTLTFERKFSVGNGFVKFSLELGQATGVTLYVKPVKVEYLK